MNHNERDDIFFDYGHDGKKTIQCNDGEMMKTSCPIIKTCVIVLIMIHVHHGLISFFAIVPSRFIMFQHVSACFLRVKWFMRGKNIFNHP
jgi:hypothetical protein